MGNEMEQFIIDIIATFLFQKLLRWDPERIDDRLAVIQQDEDNLIITKNARNDRRMSSWDFKSAFVEGAATNSIDITFWFVSYQQISTVTFGICPIESYE